MRPRTLVAAGLALVMLTVACAAERDQVEPPGDAGEIDVELVGELSDADAAEAARSVNAFGFDLHAALMAEEGANVVTSPLSVATLLAMVAAGAGGETAQQMSKVLHLDNVRDDRFAALLRAVTDSDDVVVSVANSLWANIGTPFEQDYLSFVRDGFGATAEEAPLGDQATADEIDAWVAERTEGLIEDIAADLGLPDPNAVLVLLNAVYFLGEWNVQFDPELTSSQPFTLSDGSQVDVPTMYRPSTPDEAVQVAQREGYELLRLPYGDDERFVMDVYLPSLEHDTAWLIGQLRADERAAQRGTPRRALAELRVGVGRDTGRHPDRAGDGAPVLRISGLLTDVTGQPVPEHRRAQDVHPCRREGHRSCGRDRRSDGGVDATIVRRRPTVRVHRHRHPDRHGAVPRHRGGPERLIVAAPVVLC
jgi:hypothetical protein